MTFEDYWTRISKHLLDASNDAISYTQETYNALQAGMSQIEFGMREKAKRGWDEHGGVIRDWSVEQCDDAAYEEVLDLIVYLATAIAIESGDLS